MKFSRSEKQGYRKKEAVLPSDCFTSIKGKKKGVKGTPRERKSEGKTS